MFVSVLQPWEAEVFSGGPIRGGSRCCRHQDGHNHRSLADMKSVIWRRSKLNPCNNESKPVRRFQYGSDCETLHKCNYTPAERRLDTMIEGFSKLLSLDQLRMASAVRDDVSKVNRAPEIIQWTLDDKSSEYYGRLQLPFDLESSDDFNIELDESTRMLTVCAVHNNRLKTHGGSCHYTSPRWKYSQRLDEAIQLNLIKANLNPHEGVLELRAPLKHVSLALRSNQMRADVQASAETRDNRSLVEIDTRMSSSQQQENKLTRPINWKPIEIEDIGPDEESDKMSISFTE